MPILIAFSVLINYSLVCNLPSHIAIFLRLTILILNCLQLSRQSSLSLFSRLHLQSTSRPLRANNTNLLLRLTLPSQTIFLAEPYLVEFVSLVHHYLLTMTEQATGSKKRKLNEQKFYAVRAGHTTGVYNLWEDCKTQITGFKGAACT